MSRHARVYMRAKMAWHSNRVKPCAGWRAYPRKIGCNGSTENVAMSYVSYWHVLQKRRQSMLYAIEGTQRKLRKYKNFASINT